MIAHCKFNSGRTGFMERSIKNCPTGPIERNQSLPASLSGKFYEAPVVCDVVPGQLPKFAAAQASVVKKLDHIPFFWFANVEDLLIFLVIEHPHFRRVLIEHLDVLAWIGNIVMFGQPAAEAFQGREVGIGCSVDIFLQNMVDIIIDMFGFEIGGIGWCKFGETSDNHSIVDLCADFITPVITEPSAG